MSTSVVPSASKPMAEASMPRAKLIKSIHVRPESRGFIPPNGRPTHTDVLRGLNLLVKSESDQDGIGQYIDAITTWAGHDGYLMTCKSKEMKMRLINAVSKVSVSVAHNPALQPVQFVLSDLDIKPVRSVVTLRGLPFELSQDDVSAGMTAITGSNVDNISYPEFEDEFAGIKTGELVVTFSSEPADPIPSSIMIKGYRAYVSYKNMHLEVLCFNCKQIGHYQSSCPKPCENCHKTGHRKNQCLAGRVIKPTIPSGTRDSPSMAARIVQYQQMNTVEYNKDFPDLAASGRPLGRKDSVDSLFAAVVNEGYESDQSTAQQVSGPSAQPRFRSRKQVTWTGNVVGFKTKPLNANSNTNLQKLLNQVLRKRRGRGPHRGGLSTGQLHLDASNARPAQSSLDNSRESCVSTLSEQSRKRKPEEQRTPPLAEKRATASATNTKEFDSEGDASSQRHSPPPCSTLSASKQLDNGSQVS